MKALSLTQPWAWLVAHGPKSIENRVWNTTFRGYFLIHAAKGMKADDWYSANAFAQAIDPGICIPQPAQLERGGIIGSAFLQYVMSPCAPDERESDWHMPEQFGFVLAEREVLPFTPCKGALGFWRVPTDVLRSLPTTPATAGSTPRQ